MPKDARRNKRQESQEIPLSQSSNLDGGEEAVSLLIKAQATAAKNKKARENQHLNDAKQLLDQTLEACAHDYSGIINELEELYQGFQMELAASYDRERKCWMEVVTEQDNFKESLENLIKTCTEGEESREREHIEALAVARSSIDKAKFIVSKTMMH